MEVEHARFKDSDGAEFIIDSEVGCVSITVSGGHDDCIGCTDCISSVALFVVDAPKIIAGLQAALQHAATTGDYGRGDTVESEIAEEPLSAIEQASRNNEARWRSVNEERAEQQQTVMQKGLSQIRDGLARHGERCDLVAGTHVIPHVGCILR
ncbi:hypothetical protein SEA_JKERNS_47 [Arthrobacter phage JKerns]|uniref:Uncharacterized protein n=1 Tax=Arthrobacter phage JKerns TaxID=2719212 RepID=A0A6G9LCZ5_9CAUD|nr:hypothetical protein SEA_JKERNS_47 [Arthrobacter phage JKerns]